jgi:hypothetical protein
MPIHETNGDQPQASTSTKEAFGRAGVDAGTFSRTTVSSNVTAAGINNFFHRSMGRNQSSQAVIELEKAFTKCLEENLKQDAARSVSYAIHAIDSNDNQDVAIAAVLAVARLETDKGRKGAVYIMLVEDSVPQMPIVELQVNGSNKPVQLPMTAGDYATQTLWEAIEVKLKQVYGPDMEFSPVGSDTLARGVITANEKDKLTVRSALFAAMAAIDTFIETNYIPDAERLTIQMVTNNAKTSIQMQLNDAPLTSETGLPVRADIVMNLQATVQSNLKGMPDQVVPICSLAAYTNLLFTMPPPPTNTNVRPDTRRFTPQIVLTQVESQNNLVTLETSLLSLSMAAILDYNEQYRAPFIPNATRNNPFRDFGAVGYEVNFSDDPNGRPVGKEDMTKMSTSDIYQMMNMALFDDLHVALLVNESGPNTWLNVAFSDAASGNSAAYDAIIAAANKLTGNVFGQNFPAGAPIAHLSSTRLHLGYYRTADHDDVRDLLDIDQLWMYNFCGDRNIDLAYEFAETFLGNDDPNVQLANRWQIITRCVPSATLVSYGQIVDLDPVFLTALTQSVKQAGLPLRAVSQLVDFNNARGRSSYQGVGGGLNKQTIGGILAQGAPTRQVYGGGAMGLNQYGRFRTR